MNNTNTKAALYISNIADHNVRSAADALRNMILNIHPAIVEEYKWSRPVYSYKGLMLYLAAFKTYVSLGFYEGSAIPDPKGVLEGAANPKMRHLKIRNMAELDKEILMPLILKAMQVNDRK